MERLHAGSKIVKDIVTTSVNAVGVPASSKQIRIDQTQGALGPTVYLQNAVMEHDMHGHL
jgi:hypothetical protein